MAIRGVGGEVALLAGRRWGRGPGRAWLSGTEMPALLLTETTCVSRQRDRDAAKPGTWGWGEERCRLAPLRVPGCMCMCVGEGMPFRDGRGLCICTSESVSKRVSESLSPVWVCACYTDECVYQHVSVSAGQ